MNSSQDPSDRLVDSLLREQSRRSADESLLRDIEAKLDAIPRTAAGSSRRGRGHAPVWAAAAVLVLGAGSVLWFGDRDRRMRASEGRDEIVLAPEKIEAAREALQEPWRPAAGNAGGGSTPPEREEAEAGALVEAEPAAAMNQPMSLRAKTDDSPRRGKVPSRQQPQAESMPTDAALAEMDSIPLKPRHRVVSPAPASTSSPAIAQKTKVGRVAQDPFGGAGGFVLPAEEADAVADARLSRENYGRLTGQPWKSPWKDALSTFSIDVDTASYTNLRRMILDGRPVPADAVRIEECVNYFDYRYAGPEGDGPFAVQGDLATCPWKPQHLLARVAIKGREVDANARPVSNLVFLIDVSGSMQDASKLPLLKRSMRVLLDQLDERDRLGIVVYAGSEGVVLDPTTLDERGLSKAIQALEKLESGGSTNGGAGIARAYRMAEAHLVPGGVNRVILATDGDFNVGTTGQGELVDLVKKGAARGVSLSVLGFGTGNLNDAMMEAITNEGNGNYFYIDGDQEANRVFQQKLTGTLVTIAKDVKIQVEFNPGKVQAYRLIGYANRILRDEDFANDKVDAGDIGAGHTVTAFYEIVPVGVAAPDTGSVDDLLYQKPAGREAVASDDWFTLKLRYKHPEGEVSSLLATTVSGEATAWENSGNDFRFASAVALFGMKLRQMPEVADVSWAKVIEIARPALAEDPREQRAGFVEMLGKLQGGSGAR